MKGAAGVVVLGTQRYQTGEASMYGRGEWGRGGYRLVENGVLGEGSDPMGFRTHIG